MKPLNSLDIMRAAFQTYSQRAATVLMASFVINAAALIVAILAMNAFGAAGIFAFPILALFAQQLTVGTSTLLVASEWRGEETPEAMDLIRGALARGGALFAVAIMYGIGVGFFLLLLIIPGIYFATRWSLASPALLIRRVHANDAFKTSSELTSQAMGPTFAVVFFMFAINWLAPHFIDGAVGGEMAPLEVQVLTTFAISALFSPIGGLAYAELYMRLAHAVTPPAPQTPAPTGPWIGVPQPMQGAPAFGGAGAAAPYAAAASAAPTGFGAPPAPFGTPPQAQPYAAPPQAYGAPPQARPYGAPPQAQPYAAPPQAQPYGTAPAPPQHQSYAAPPQAYPAPAQHQSYAAPPQAYPAPPQAYPAPAQHQSYAAPPQAYPAPAPPQPYGAPPAPPQTSASPGLRPGPSQGPVHPGREHSIAPPGM